MIAPPVSRVSGRLPAPVPGMRLRMSYEEWLVWAPDNLISEWADGKALVLMTATPLHQRLVRLLLQMCDLFVTARELGEVHIAPLEVKLWDGGPAREPDVFFVSTARRDQLGTERYKGQP